LIRGSGSIGINNAFPYLKTSGTEIEGLPEDIVMASSECGNPTALAKLYAREVVLDLGSGLGLMYIFCKESRDLW